MGCRTPTSGSFSPPARGRRKGRRRSVVRGGLKIRHRNALSRVQNDVRCIGMRSVRSESASKAWSTTRTSGCKPQRFHRPRRKSVLGPKMIAAKASTTSSSGIGSSRSIARLQILSMKDAPAVSSWQGPEAGASASRDSRATSIGPQSGAPSWGLLHSRAQPVLGLLTPRCLSPVTAADVR